MNSSSNAEAALLTTLADAFRKIQDPRDPRGVRHDFHGMVILVFLGLLARIPYIAQIQRWAKKHWHTLREPLGFKRTKPPVDTTLSRNLASVSVEEFQAAFTEFLNLLLLEKTDSLTAAVDGKCAKQMRDENGDPLYMLNVFVHDLKVTLEQYSIRGDKTNEPGCLKKHLEKLFDTYPALKLLTGDAIFAQRPLLEVLQEHECDYLFQVKKNQGDAYEAIEYAFQDALNMEPDDMTYSKKKGWLKSASCGVTLTTPNTFASG
jgi:hypothetical protein